MTVKALKKINIFPNVNKNKVILLKKGEVVFEMSKHTLIVLINFSNNFFLKYFFSEDMLVVRIIVFICFLKLLSILSENLLKIFQ